MWLTSHLNGQALLGVIVERIIREQVQIKVDSVPHTVHQGPDFGSGWKTGEDYPR